MNRLTFALGTLAAMFLVGFLAADEAEDKAIVAINKLGGKTKGMPVTEVRLVGTKITDAELEDLAAFKQLHKLWLQDTQGTDVGLMYLPPLQQLKELYAHGTKVTDDFMEHLAALEQLEKLSLERTGVTDAGLLHLAALKQLQRLWLSSNDITDAGLKGITTLKKVTILWLARTRVTDAGLKDLASLVNLTELGLSGTKVTDAGLKDLASLTRLRKLDLTGTKVTEAGLIALKKTFPDCQIVSSFNVPERITEPVPSPVPLKVEEYPFEYYHDFRGQPKPAELTWFNVKKENFVKEQPEGLRITLPKTFIHEWGGVGLTTAFGLKGDFEVTYTIEVLQADKPPSGNLGVGPLLAVTTGAVTTGGNSWNGTATVARVLNARGNQVVFWDCHTDSRTLANVWPCTDTTGRLRLKRMGTTLYYYWAPGTQGDNFQEVKQCEYSNGDIENVRLAVTTGRAPANVDVRLLDLRIRTLSPAEGAQAPAPKTPSRRAMWILAIFIALGLITGGFLVWLRKRNADTKEETPPTLI